VAVKDPEGHEGMVRRMDKATIVVIVGVVITAIGGIMTAVGKASAPSTPGAGPDSKASIDQSSKVAIQHNSTVNVDQSTNNYYGGEPRSQNQNSSAFVPRQRPVPPRRYFDVNLEAGKRLLNDHFKGQLRLQFRNGDRDFRIGKASGDVEAAEFCEEITSYLLGMGTNPAGPPSEVEGALPGVYLEEMPLGQPSWLIVGPSP
jgi:hypothetical protein